MFMETLVKMKLTVINWNRKDKKNSQGFFNLFNVCAEVVSSKSIFENTKTLEFEPQSNIVSVAKQLKEDICFCNTVPEHKWPPTFESVTAEFRDPLDSVKLFLKNLLAERRAEQYHQIRTSLNLPYVNIMLDVDAAINSYKFRWSNFTCF